MAELRLHAFFHSLIVVGASLGGCGGKTLSEAGNGAPGTSGAPGASGAAGGNGVSGAGAQAGVSGTAGAAADPSKTPLACANPAQWQCDDFGTLGNCRCDPSAPVDGSACSSPFKFSCSQVQISDGTWQVVGCHCDPNALTPYDCAYTQQFSCGYADYFTGCVCDVNAPLSSADCTNCSVFVCSGQVPEYGCRCEPCIR